MKDFTLTTYQKLLQELIDIDYSFQTFKDFFQQPEDKTVILRHDVDSLPGNSLKMARLENELGIRATYFFRTIPKTFKPKTINEIAGLEHEIGYHYENMDYCNGDVEKAIKDFEVNLLKLRDLYPVETICMHGSPLSKWDNRDLWRRYTFRDYGILGEPYLDVDFGKIFYITDTGRSWNNTNSSVRDKVKSKFDISIKDTNHLIEKIQNNDLPDKIMINVHPQRWTDKPLPWIRELVGQNVKNVIKRYLLKSRPQ